MSTSAQAVLLLNIWSPATSWTSLLLHCCALELDWPGPLEWEMCDLAWDWEEPEEVRGSWAWASIQSSVPPYSGSLEQDIRSGHSKPYFCMTGRQPCLAR